MSEPTKKKPRNLRPETLLVHGGTLRSQFGEMSEALFLTQGYSYDSAEQAERRFTGEDPGFQYSRFSNPTVAMFEERMRLLEGAEDVRACATGMAAVTAGIIGYLSAGQHIVASKAMFGSCRYIVEDLCPRFGIEFTLVDGQFPPENSAHAISGELIQVDHLERRFHLRVDRDDSQQAGYFDLPLDSVMLPYGSIYYHGAPAALQDIPLGTHLHGLYYLKAADDKAPPVSAAYRRVTSDAAFKRCFRLEDDFSFHARQKQTWKIEKVSLADKKLTATLQREGTATGEPKVFDLLGSTRVRIRPPRTFFDTSSSCSSRRRNSVDSSGPSATAGATGAMDVAMRGIVCGREVGRVSPSICGAPSPASR